MQDQKLLFDGFIRIEILNHISNAETKVIVPTAIINLCNIFFRIDLKQLEAPNVTDEMQDIERYDW